MRGIKMVNKVLIVRVSNELNAEINNIFVDGDKYCAAIYFTVKKLEQ